MKILIAIPEFNNRDLTEKLIKSIPKTEDEVKIFVGNDGACIFSKPVIDLYYHKISYLNFVNNVGYTENSNRTINTALILLGWETENIIICLVNSDVVFIKDCLTKLIRKAEEGYLIGPASLVPSKFVGRPTSHRQFRSVLDDQDGFEELDMISGACMVFPKSLWDSTGGLDSRYKHYFSDDEFSLQAKSLGYKVGYLKDAFIKHAVSASYNKAKEQREMAVLASKDRLIFQKRHPEIVWTTTGKYIWRNK